jgi:crotonobetainyl-CoA:carnitine CoA-transferase CaiB-like acyl-CoA transferase
VTVGGGAKNGTVHFATSDLVSLTLGGVAMNCGYDPDPAGHYDLPPIAPQAWHSFPIAGEQLVIGIVSALIYRLRSGLGQKVSVAIHEAVAKDGRWNLSMRVGVRDQRYLRPSRASCRYCVIVGARAVRAGRGGA